jgi:diguanylate cyclase (GGDEF)-like protein
VLAEPYVMNVPQDGVAEPRSIEHHCTSSIGVALFINHDASLDDLIKWADMAMYQAKESGRNRVHFFES